VRLGYVVFNDALAAREALADLNKAYRNFLDSVSGKRKGQNAFRVLGNGRLRLPKIGDIEVRWCRGLPAVPSSVTEPPPFKTGSTSTT
jgi:putative transposase